MKRYWTMRCSVDMDNGITTCRTALDTHKPKLECTVSGITWFLDRIYPDLEITSPAEDGLLLADAVRTLELYGYLKVWLKDKAGQRYTVEFMEV